MYILIILLAIIVYLDLVISCKKLQTGSYTSTFYSHIFIITIEFYSIKKFYIKAIVLKYIYINFK